ncbi:hypothetical protein [Yinghuangia sp. YIM S10712]|uniref:hypothetical protein n=1 Tax=Yinghuangia sp. YIM S10712 TaxID=3436930 RepID=UPI003F52E907
MTDHHYMAADHPAWTDVAGASPGTKARLMTTREGIWLAEHSPQEGLVLTCVLGDDAVKPTTHTVRAEELPPAAPDMLLRPLHAMHWATRIPNPSLWDAVSTAVIRQVIQAAQARKVYRAWCAAYGTVVETTRGRMAVTPTPERVLDLSDADFKRVGAAFHRTALQAVASAYLEQTALWESLSPADLVTELEAVPRIGPWTAAAAVSDYTGNFSVYPHHDLAVRTWAARIAPAYPWPVAEKEFGRLWRGWATTVRELHTLTLLTLTWGSTHVHHRPSGDDAITP